MNPKLVGVLGGALVLVPLLPATGAFAAGHAVPTCTGVTGDAASFVVSVDVFIDGVTAPALHRDRGPEAGWSFSIPLDLHGRHTVTVTDSAAVDPSKAYPIASAVLDCPTVPTVPTIPPTVPTVPASTSAVPATAAPSSVEIPVVVADPTTVVDLPTPPAPAPVPAPTPSRTVPVATTAPDGPAPTLPATGPSRYTVAFVVVGLWSLALGVAAIAAARRPRKAAR